MKTYHNHRAEPYFTFLKNGQKTIEGRIKKGKYCFIESGDGIEVSNENETDSVNVKVKRVTDYHSIEQMLNTEDFKKVLPDAESIEQGVGLYRKFYSSDQEAEFGVIAIEVGLVE